MKLSNYIFSILIVFSGLGSCSSPSDENESAIISKSNSLDIIAYYSGNGSSIADYPIDKLDQIIYSFVHLNGNQLAIDNAEDSVSLLQITALKQKHPQLKVLVALGGWGGCETCSDVFSLEKNREEFAKSALNFLQQYNADGLDLDWEYPAISGFPGHTYKPEDKQNFTSLVITLRDILGPAYELSFAAGGTDRFLLNSVEWDKVMPLVDRVNLMSYDLVSGFSSQTGHHTPLYSNSNQITSADHAIQYLDSIGVPSGKIVIGAAFYARIWEKVSAVNNGIYQSGDFLKSIAYAEMESQLNTQNGFQTYWDSASQATYAYNKALNQFATFDDPRSLSAKIAYAKENKLGESCSGSLEMTRNNMGFWR